MASAMDRATASHPSDRLLQEKLAENEQLRTKVSQLETQLSQCLELQQVAEESRNRIKDLQQACLEQADSFQLGLAKKHQEELLAKIEEHLESELQWQKERRELLLEIEELKSMVARLQGEASESDSCNGQLEELNAELQNYRRQCSEQADHIRELEESRRNTAVELERLRGVDRSNSSLSERLQAAEQRVRELEFATRKLEGHLESAKEEAAEVSKSAARQANAHRVEKTALESRIGELEKRVGCAETECDELRRELGVERMKARSALEEMERLKATLSELQNSCKPDGTGTAFSDFVKLKRQLASLQEENEKLKEKLTTKCQSGSAVCAVHVLQHPEKNSVLGANSSESKTVKQFKPKVHKDR